MTANSRNRGIDNNEGESGERKWEMNRERSRRMEGGEEEKEGNDWRSNYYEE